MFYSRQPHRPSLLRFLIMFVVALGLALFFLITDPAYDRAGVMAGAALLCGGYLLWHAYLLGSVQAVKEAIWHTPPPNQP